MMMEESTQQIGSWLEENTLQPIECVRSKGEFEQAIKLETFEKIRAIEGELLNDAEKEEFSVDGFCMPCDKAVPFIVDMKWGGERSRTGFLPNWRERLECPFCQMNNRQRLITAIVKQRLASAPNGAAAVYFMEQVTPIFDWAQKALVGHQIYGSEYLGYEYKSGEFVNGLRHEDVMNLSFDNQSLDLIVSNDVFEHVPEPNRSFAECARVLRPGGTMLATIPFHNAYDVSTIRAELTSDGINNFLPPIYHGNPVSDEGSLVFTDFGWDLIDSIRSSGFTEVSFLMYASIKFGHYGGFQLVLEAKK